MKTIYDIPFPLEYETMSETDKLIIQKSMSSMIIQADGFYNLFTYSINSPVLNRGYSREEIIKIMEDFDANYAQDRFDRADKTGTSSVRESTTLDTVIGKYNEKFTRNGRKPLSSEAFIKRFLSGHTRNTAAIINRMKDIEFRDVFAKYSKI